MTGFEAFILGVVEGVTEFLPISSTGHLVLASTLLGIAQTEFHKSFQIAIQLGAVFSVLLLYWRSFLNLEIVKRLAVAFAPTALVGFALYGFVRGQLLGNDEVVLAALFAGGIALIAFEWWYKKRPPVEAQAGIGDISWRQAVAVGFFQSIALVPGVSRSAATILGGLLVGLNRTAIVEFSFLLAVPTMAAATGLDLLKTQAWHFAAGEWGLLAVGFFTSFIVALAAIKFLLRFISTHTFVAFGIYRIVLAALFFLFVL